MPATRHIKRIDECRDAIVNMHVNGISNGQISRTLRIAMPTVRRILDEWKAQAGAIARAQARFAGMVDPACDTIERAIKRDDKAAFRLVEGLGVLGGHNSSIATDKSISISVNTLLATTQPNADDGCEQPSSRKGPTPQVQLQDGAQNFSEIPQLVDNKALSDTDSEVEPNE